MKILIISGFLGAGKTTFIKELAQRTKKDFVILENEYGEVGIDGPLLSKNQNPDDVQMNVWELTEGCVCCSMKSDFLSSIVTIANTLAPEFLVVEPTGVGVLSKVIENIKQIEYEKIMLLSPITVLDGHSYDRYLAEFQDIYLDQIKNAGTILLSKMEASSDDEIKTLHQNISQINQNALLISGHYTKQDDAWWHELLRKQLSGIILPTEDVADPDIENIGLNYVKLEHENELLLLLSDILHLKYGNIVRAKGYLKAGNSWLRFDLADRLYAITGIEPMKESRVVFIGKNIRRNELRKILQKNAFSLA